MLFEKMLKSGMEDLKNITKADFYIWDNEGNEVVATTPDACPEKTLLQSFSSSMAECQDVSGYHFLKVKCADDGEYVLAVNAYGTDARLLGRVAVSEMIHLHKACSSEMDRDGFFQSLFTERMPEGDLCKNAEQLGISLGGERCVFLIEVAKESQSAAKELLQNMFSEEEEDVVTAINEKNLILVKQVSGVREGDICGQCAREIVSMLNTELMVKGRVAYGTVVKTLEDVVRSYKEAKVALEVAQIFYEDRLIADYSALGIGRLIHQLPKNLCEMFIAEVFGDNKILELEEEELNIIEKFFENNLNVSETARELVLHRNTLVYRLEKLQKYIGLDIRRFDDAMTFKIAMMVARYVKYLEK